MCDCKRCGNCCSNYLPLSKEEIYSLKEIIKKRNLKPITNIFGNDCINSCPFLNGNICTIYEERPEICRVFTCTKFKDKNYDNTKTLFNTKRELVDLRKELF